MRKFSIAGLLCAGLLALLSPASANVATGAVGKTLGQGAQFGEAQVIQIRHRHLRRHHHHRHWRHRHHRRHWYGFRIRHHHRHHHH